MQVARTCVIFTVSDPAQTTGQVQLDGSFHQGPRRVFCPSGVLYQKADASESQNLFHPGYVSVVSNAFPSCFSHLIFSIQLTPLAPGFPPFPAGRSGGGDSSEESAGFFRIFDRSGGLPVLLIVGCSLGKAFFPIAPEAEPAPGTPEDESAAGTPEDEPARWPLPLPALF